MKCVTLVDAFSRIFHVCHQIRAAKAMQARRRVAAAAITSLGRGFQGRAEARRVRVNRHNEAAGRVQALWRGRIAQRFEKF